MKIAMIQTPLIHSTGAERHTLRLAIELQKKGHWVEIFTNDVDSQKCFPELISKVKINVAPCPINFRRFRYYKALLGMREIGKELAKKDFDIINNHVFPSEWAVYFAKRRRNVPAVWMCHEPPFWFFQPAERKGKSKIYWPLFEIFDRISVKSINKILVRSNLMKNMVKKIYHRDSMVVRDVIDGEQFENIFGQSFKKKYQLENSFILLQVGTLIHYKRQGDSIKALNLLSKKYKNLKLIFIGVEYQEYKKNLINLIKKYGLEDKILFLGPVPDEELKQAYAACDLFLFPAFQSWSLVAMEAMVSKKPVIVSNRCGISEIIANNRNGFVVDHTNYQKIAKNIELLINNEGLRKEIGLNAYKCIKENFSSWENYAENMEKIFKNVKSDFEK